MGQRAAIYVRVSTTDQSCQGQIAELTVFAGRSGFELLGIFKETASGTRNNRLARNRCLQLAQARRIDAVLVTELSRWGRSRQDLLVCGRPLVGKPDFEPRLGGIQVRYGRMCGLLMRHLLAAGLYGVREIGSKSKRNDGLDGPSRPTGFSDPVLSTVCPYLVRRPACTLQLEPPWPVSIRPGGQPNDFLSLLRVSDLADPSSLH